MKHHLQKTKIMNVFRIACRCIVAVLLALTAPFGLNNAIALRQDPSVAQEGMEILTRGPIHEAFAETVTFDPEPGLVSPKSPPDAIEEIPPEQRLEGANVNWIPGYWAWDDERTDYLWVSGIWRAMPPGRQWVPGYWGRSGEGAQWTSGYWADAQVSEVEYLPEPPATVEVGPNVTAPSADHGWLPGCWLWQQNRYAWRPGYWATGQSDWNWIPAHYVWTPRGYLFVDGYFDYSVARRGIVYAPVYFSSNIYAQRGYSYSPRTVINLGVFANHLFLRSSYGHYYYGDYYGSNYANSGFYPWYSYNSTQYGYDPFYAQQRWLHRLDSGWEQTIQADFQNRFVNENARPPRTWEDQSARLVNAALPNEQKFVVAAPLADLSKSIDHPLRLQPLEKTERQQFAQQQKAIRQHREQRQKLEDQPVEPSAVETKPAREVRAAKVKLSASPIVALPADKLGKEYAPPQRHKAPQLDLKVAPTARSAGGKTKSINETLRRTTGSPQVAPPNAEPKGKSKSESKGSPPGGSNEKPQGKSKDKSPNNPK